MKHPVVAGTETAGFTTREARDAEWSRLKNEGTKGVCRHTTQENGRVVYVVTWPRTLADITVSTINEVEELLAENSSKKSLDKRARI